MEGRQKISNIYRRFSTAEGNQHIASEYAIVKLQEIIEKFNVRNVLEVGLGIGSIVGSLLCVNKNLRYSGTEANKFCLETLPGNLGPEYSRLKIYKNLRSVPEQKQFELVIIDGKDEDLDYIKKVITANGIIGVEGDRIPQQEVLQEIFPYHKYVHCISKVRNKPFSPFPTNQWQGGIKIIFIDPTFSQKLWWARERISTRLKYFYRKK